MGHTGGGHERSADESILEELRVAVALGLEAARRGELHDGEAFFETLEAEEQLRESQEKRNSRPAEEQQP